MAAAASRLAVLLLCLLHLSTGFQQPNAPSALTRASSPRDVSVSAARCGEDNGRDGDHISRRDALSRALYGLGATLAVSAMGADRASALDIPSFMVSSEADRVKGMPVPSKKGGGLSNKLRSVAKIMVSAGSIPICNRPSIEYSHPCT